MRIRLLIIIFLYLGILNGFAQIVITTADMPMPGNAIYQANDTMPMISVGIADTNQIWNMDSLVQHTVDTSTIMTYAMAPNAAFSSANMAVKQGSADFYGYLLNSATSTILLGGGGIADVGGSQTAINQIGNPAELLMNFPATYNTAFTSNYYTSAKFYFGQTITPPGITIDSIHQKSGVQKSVIVDGWGTLTTPLPGGPFNVLRIKETKISHDTTMAFFFGSWNDIPGGITVDSTTTYSWWTNGLGVPLVIATMDSSGTVDKVQWLTAPPSQAPLFASVSAVNFCTGSCDGSATATANWGTPPYTYSWNTSPVQINSSATGLCAGPHTVTITDSLNATSSATVTIYSPPQAVITANGTTLNTGLTASGFQWYLDGVIISGATSSSYTVSQNGNYTVAASNGNGCIDTSAAFNFNTIGINEFEANNSIFIYPNPSSNQITIKFDAAASLFGSIKSNVLIEIKNELGQCVKKAGLKQLVNGKNELLIDVADLPDGIYFVQIQNQNTIVNKKFIKQ